MLRPSSHVVAPTADAALDEALRALLAPIARLCLARGVGFAVMQEHLKRAYVDAARAASGSGSRDVSRVSTATGLTRREVTRLSRPRVAPAAAARPSPATQVFTRWMGTRKLHDATGQPRPLRRQGRAPSFEALARSVTRDVHPRSLLDELCRLGLARLDEASDMVHLVREVFAPQRDQARMLGFLGSNGGDHLAAAVANVLAEEPPHLEQAIFADGLAAESLAEVRQLVRSQWKALLTGLVPQLEVLIEADRKAGRRAHQRVRIGLYSYHAAMPAQTGAEDAKDE